MMFPGLQAPFSSCRAFSVLGCAPGSCRGRRTSGELRSLDPHSCCHYWSHCVVSSGWRRLLEAAVRGSRSQAAAAHGAGASLCAGRVSCLHSSCCCSAPLCNTRGGQVLKGGGGWTTRCLKPPMVLSVVKFPRTHASVGGHSAVLKICTESSFFGAQTTCKPAPHRQNGAFPPSHDPF